MFSQEIRLKLGEKNYLENVLKSIRFKCLIAPHNQLVSFPRIIPLNLKIVSPFTAAAPEDELQLAYICSPSQFPSLDPLLSSFLCCPLCIPDPAFIPFMSEIVFLDPPNITSHGVSTRAKAEYTSFWRESASVDVVKTRR